MAHKTDGPDSDRLGYFLQPADISQTLAQADSAIRQAPSRSSNGDPTTTIRLLWRCSSATITAQAPPGPSESTVQPPPQENGRKFPQIVVKCFPQQLGQPSKAKSPAILSLSSVCIGASN